MSASEAVYRDSVGYDFILFDLRLPGAAERLHRARAFLQERSDIEALDQNHLVLIVGCEGWGWGR